MNRSGENLGEKVKAIAWETVRVLEVVLCWAVALPIVLIALAGIILWEKAQKLGLALSTLVYQSTRRERPVNSIPLQAAVGPHPGPGEFKSGNSKEAATSR